MMVLMSAAPKLLLLSMFFRTSLALMNGLALTPPQGWTAWNSLVFHPTQPAVELAMRGLAKPHDRSDGSGGQTSLVELGYGQASLDDAWQACDTGVNRSFHDAEGNPLIDLNAFPNMSAMTAFGKTLGIESGWYMNNCNCAENQFTDPVQIANIVRRSAHAVAALGFTSLKLDSCGQFNNLTLWAEELNKTGVAVTIENCHQGGMVPGQHKRVPGQGSCTGTTEISDCPYTSYRTSDDIIASFGHVINNINSMRPFLGDESRGDPPPRSRPGGWAYPDALQTGMLGVLNPIGFTPEPDGWMPQPLVEDRTDFGLHCITSSPLMLAFNVSNDTLVELVWDIVANEEAIAINQAWVGTPGRLENTIVPKAAAMWEVAEEEVGGGYVLRKGQLGKAGGWGPLAADCRCPDDVDQMPGAVSTCSLLRVATTTLAAAQSWCTAHPDCAAFSYRGGGATAAETVVYFKGATSVFFQDSNFRFNGQVQTGGVNGSSAGWLSQIKSKIAPPGTFRKAPCEGTTCPANARPCHIACLSIAPCCSAKGPTGEALQFANGEAQLWSKRLANGSLALLFVNLGKSPLSHSFTLESVGMGPSTVAGNVSVRDVWKRTTSKATIGRGGSIEFDSVAGHDSRFVVLAQVRHEDTQGVPM